MKILAIGKNYVNNKTELKDAYTTFPLIFSKPESSLVSNNKNIIFPTITKKLIYEVELVIKIGKTGKNIKKTEATSYISEIAVGIDYTAKDVLNKIQETKGAWELAKGFDGAAPVSKFIPISNFKNLNNINFSLFINNEEKQTGNTSLMIYSFSDIITFISKFMTLVPGDLIFTGTPAFGVGQNFKGDHMKAFLEDELLLDYKLT